MQISAGAGSARRAAAAGPPARPWAALLVVSCFVIAGRPAAAQTAPQAATQAAAQSGDDEGCLACHSDPDLSLELPGGVRRSLAVAPSDLAGSVHAGLRCTDCHAGMTELPHPPRAPRSEAEYRAGFREACRSCHFENYQRSFDSVHQRLLARGDVHAPSCVECHGGHAVARAGTPRSAISRTCATCHKGISDAYVGSVHGRALLQDENADVPVCTDCHRAHDIDDPRQEAWLLKTPQLCGKCHTDAAVMSRYGLSTNVLQSYLSDFHGMTASLSRGNGRAETRVTALCVDCHGVHDIRKVDDPGSPVLKANLVKTCRKCHAGATESFPAAWLSHYEPTWQRAPLVRGVKVFYAVFIPFVIGGLVLQILLHLWRVVVNR
jgi:predicted CXXCH cytochrome family protein